jgi:hypothetical protein
MTVPIGISSEPEGPAGYSYAALVARAEPAEVLAALRGVRFSGWVAPREGEWVPVVAAGVGTVASRRRGVVGVGEAVAAATRGAVVAVRVLSDRQLVMVGWGSGREVARYVSDPSREPGAHHDVSSDPFGYERLDELAASCGHPEAGEELLDLFAEPLDPDEEIESERLGRALLLLGLPTWLVSAWRVPRPLTSGPSPRDLVRLGAGRPGAAGWLADRAVRAARRHRRPPPVLADPPHSDPGHDEAMWW